MNGTRLIALWRKYLFEPQSPIPLALFRIWIGLLLLETQIIHVGENVLVWYGPHAVSSFDAVKTHFWKNLPALRSIRLVSAIGLGNTRSLDGKYHLRLLHDDRTLDTHFNDSSFPVSTFYAQPSAVQHSQWRRNDALLLHIHDVWQCRRSIVCRPTDCALSQTCLRQSRTCKKSCLGHSVSFNFNSRSVTGPQNATKYQATSGSTERQSTGSLAQKISNASHCRSTICS